VRRKRLGQDVYRRGTGTVCHRCYTAGIGAQAQSRESDGDARPLFALRDSPQDRQVADSNEPALDVDGTGADQSRQAPRNMHAHGPQQRREFFFWKAITGNPDLCASGGAFGHGQLMEILCQAGRRGLEREIPGEPYQVRHMLARNGEQLEAHGRMFPHETVHRVDVEQTQPCLGRCPGADDMPPRAERGADAECVSRAIEHPEDLLPPRGIGPVELYPPRFEDAEVQTGISLHEHVLARRNQLRSAADGDGLQNRWIELGKIRDGLQNRKHRITCVHLGCDMRQVCDAQRLSRPAGKSRAKRRSCPSVLSDLLDIDCPKLRNCPK